MKFITIPAFFRITRGLIIIFALFSCASGQIREYRPTSTYTENDLRDISDEDIRKAFEAEAQIITPVKIAWYNLNQDDMVERIQTVNSDILLNYKLPKTLVEGFSNQARYTYTPPVTINLKALRLLAARAKCDLLVLVGSRFSVSSSYNGLSFFNILLVPAFFLPFLDYTFSIASEMYVFDVRNGFMYLHYECSPQAVTDKYKHWSQLNRLETKYRDYLMEQTSDILTDTLAGLLQESRQ